MLLGFPRIVFVFTIGNLIQWSNFYSYYRDRRDGLSKEGCGRVAVLKYTGLVKSYTLECNYNTGCIVNIIPPTQRPLRKHLVQPLLVPPKYTPQIYEEVWYSEKTYPLRWRTIFTPSFKQIENSRPSLLHFSKVVNDCKISEAKSLVISLSISIRVLFWNRPNRLTRNLEWGIL